MLTAIFIDGGYLDKNANPQIDYLHLSTTLAGNERSLLTRVVCFAPLFALVLQIIELLLKIWGIIE